MKFLSYAAATILSLLASSDLLFAETKGVALSADADYDVAPLAPFDRQIVVDAQGVRELQAMSESLSGRAEWSLVQSDSIWRKFGRVRLDRTVESGTDFTLTSRPTSTDTLDVKVSSWVTRQDVSNVAAEGFGNLSRNRTLSLLHGWEHELMRGVSVRFLAGAAQCTDDTDGQSQIYPLGGLQLQGRFAKGTFTAGLSQRVAGGGALSGIYGSQVERSLSMGAEYRLAKDVTLFLDCAISSTYRAFNEEGVLHRAPIVVASARVDYSVSSDLKGSVGYVHRSFIGSGELAHGDEGSTALASLSYLFF